MTGRWQSAKVYHSGWATSAPAAFTAAAGARRTAMSALIVITNAPNRDVALKIARALIERKLAACVNILAECTSVYRWQGRLENAHEGPPLIKTRAAI